MNIWWCHSTFAQCVFATSSRDYLFYVCRGEGKCDSMQSNASKPNGKMNSPSQTKLPWRCLVNSLITAKRVPAGTKKLLPRGFCECSITMLFSYVSGQQWIDSNKKCRRIAGNLDCHGNAAIRRGVHHPMERIQGFTWSHWMPPSVECLRRIGRRPPWSTNSNETHKTLTKQNF